MGGGGFYTCIKYLFILFNLIFWDRRQEETGSYIAKEIILDPIGSKKFILLVTDNAANKKAAWGLVKDKYSHISTASQPIAK